MSAQPPQPNPLIHGYHSKEAYSYSKEDSDAIIKTTSYHRKDFELAVIWFPPRTHTNVAASLAAEYREPTTSLGDLDKLPLELITNVCLQLDIASLFQLRQVNARGQQIVNALHEYRVITKHALNAFLALLKTRTTPCVTLGELYRNLCTQDCSLCGGYGNLVYLPTWTRCCSACLRKDASEIRSTNAAGAKRHLNLSKKAFESLPRLLTLPGTYTMDARSRSGRVNLVPTEYALSAFRDDNAGTEPTTDMKNKITMPIVCQDTLKPMQAFMACCALPSYNPRTNEVEREVSCAGCQKYKERSGGRREEPWAGPARDRVYSHTGFLAHFTWCEHAQSLWKDSNGGTITPSRLPYLCKMGGFLTPRF
ncbi:uncharacterized protein N0V89_001549 [Didymosphaeria variabile]|uniref:F-box domain-containing protein n=1 Tax=Didymosphaeria variabile TaxID=1932322 RepID=A0A9W9CGU9_9PLEO|nr:uncharacterized protein N0V89_001549 [Didymosphaeria variabile]KAJ4360980.1 hypothetical protein N0V89_001549 [Didymosphaeria variabile]